MEPYHKRENSFYNNQYGKLLQVKLFNDEVSNKSNSVKYVKQIADITDEKGLKLAYETKMDHINITIYFSQEQSILHNIILMILKLPFDDTLNKLKRSRCSCLL